MLPTPMKILYVGRTARVGGGSTFRYNIGRGLIARGHRIWVAAWPGEMVPRYRQAGIGYLWSPPVPLNVLWILRAIRRHRIDLVHASNINPASAAARACRWTRTPLVISVHNTLNKRECRRDCLRLARKVIAFDEIAEQRLHRHREFIDDGKILRLCRPIEHRPAIPQEDPPFRVVYIGRLSSRKGQLALALIEAIGEFTRSGIDAELTILGGGSLMKEVRHGADADTRMAGRQRVRVLGTVVDPAPVVGQAHVVVGAGYAALEAIMQGRAVIGAGFNGFGVVDEENLLVARGANFGDTGGDWEVTAASFLAALRQLHDVWVAKADRERHWRLDRVLAPLHSIDVVAGQLEKIYQEVLGA